MKRGLGEHLGIQFETDDRESKHTRGEQGSNLTLRRSQHKQADQGHDAREQNDVEYASRFQ